MSSSQEATKQPLPNPRQRRGKQGDGAVHSSFGGIGCWFLTLFAAEEIPATIVTYVALLMLLQLGLAPAEATLCSALLYIPWVLKSFMRPWVSRVGGSRLLLHFIEALLFASLVFLAFSFNKGAIAVFFALLLVSLLSAWHEMVARMYYEQRMRPFFQLLLTIPKHVCSQTTVIFTYGALIFLVGTLQVYFRQIRYSWSLGCYVAAGLFLLFSLSLSLSKRGGSHLRVTESQRKTETCRSSLLGRDRGRHLLVLFFLLLPQALMFFSRVLYLYDTHARGGLQCTMQEIGFAQGTVGVMAFSFGIALGRLFVRRYTLQTLFWPMALSIVLSPLVYLGMTIWPPQSLSVLCCCTFSAQLLFGLGLGACRLPIRAISGTRYRDTITMLQIPLVSAAMIVPMALSGWMVEQLGYGNYFLVNALTAPICLLGIFLLRRPCDF